ncbi:MAG: SDR family oxidoreductase [Chloroflexi bacterium]|jgi:NAD(P)-dependent dehydrogenase (short-subunit alcohol dehydrogenase family)|nr:SDR family oxidoreductase [Chloroflexota bacterium]
MPLSGKTILITGAARRLGKVMALAVARAGGDVILHHGHSPVEAAQTQSEIQALGRNAHIIQADLNDPAQITALIPKAVQFDPLFALVNNASIFDALRLENTRLEDWERHQRVNLSAPFLLSQAFAAHIDADVPGRIINILDWRALRPEADHLPYTISKAGLAALTRSLAIALAPNITVNGLAFGAILPPSDGNLSEDLLANVPAGRWAILDEVGEALLFLLTGPSYITGEIIHLDGGRHLV